MDEALIGRFVDIFERCGDWSRSHRHARRAGLMIFLHPKKGYDWVTGVRWDPKLFVVQPRMNEIGTSFEGHSPMAWRRDFVEKVVALGFVPDLESLPSVKEVA
jgi:hypothetical protein